MTITLLERPAQDADAPGVTGATELKHEMLKAAPDQAPRSFVTSLTVCLVLGALIWIGLLQAIL